uniref:Uncharacterized protein n=1 Tax=Leersia perrieri TaxID=77586 RepID=A0A0D9VA75_9ORYZ
MQRIRFYTIVCQWSVLKNLIMINHEIWKKPADDADDAPPGPVGALDADDLEIFEVGEVAAAIGGGGGEVGEAVVPLLLVGRVEERCAGVDREVGAHHHHREVAAGARHRRRTHAVKRSITVPAIN